MKRLRTENINTPEHFDDVWSHPEEYHYDPTRMDALIKTVKDGDNVLDVGAGVFGACQYIVQEKNLDCALYAFDQSWVAQKIVEKIAHEIEYVVGDISSGIKFHENFFDVVICGETIEHMEEPEKLVKELIRVCEVGGSVVLSTVDTNCENAKKLVYPEHIWEFTPEDLIGFFSPYGETKYETVGDYHFIYFTKR